MRRGVIKIERDRRMKRDINKEGNRREIMRKKEREKERGLGEK